MILHTNFGKLTGDEYTEESWLQGIEYTGESQLPSSEYTRKSQLPSSEYTRESITNINNSRNIGQNLKSFLGKSYGTMRHCLKKKKKTKISWRCPLKFLGPGLSELSLILSLKINN